MKQHKKFDVLILYVEAFVLIFVIIFALINPREKVVSEDVQALLEKENQQPQLAEVLLSLMLIQI